MDRSELNNVLFGANPLEGIVAIEPAQELSSVAIYRRSQTGETMVENEPFVPWLVSSQERSCDGAQTTRLEGDAHCWLIEFHESGWRGFLDARRELRDEHIGLVSYGSQSKQFLMRSGMTLFKGMNFDDLRRMQIDIETTSLSPEAADASVFMISASDSTGRCTVLFDQDEPLMLAQLVELVQEWDPDVVEGHNFYGFDLPYLRARSAKLGVALDLGRGRAPIQVGTSRNVSIGANARPYTPVYIPGRHIVDTYFQVQRFDVARAQISSYGLKECALAYNIAAPDRVYLDRSQIFEAYRRDPKRVLDYARQDVEETRALAALIEPIEFYQSQMVPDTLQNVAVSGTGEKLNSMLVREYLRQRRAIPEQKASQGYPGGYTQVRQTGVIAPIVKVDVESLYPSLMLTHKIKPASDTLDIFLPMLQDLTTRRLEAKSRARETKDNAAEYYYWDGLQTSFKVIINSFYGYIGGPFYFNDFQAARKVTVTGQEIVRQIADQLEATGSLVVEIDTDGVYFRPPAGVRTPQDEANYVEQVGSVLPAGIRLAHDGHYKAMLSLKVKNYVLVEESGRRIYKGSSLRSRADESYGRRFLEKSIDLLLDGDIEQLALYYESTLVQLQSGGVPIEDLAKRERVTHAMITSDQRKRAGEAIKSLGVGQGDIVQLYQRSDTSLQPVTNYNNDEDTEYYADKLHKFASRLREAFEDEALFNRVFPRPVGLAKRLLDAAQPSLFE